MTGTAAFELPKCANDETSQNLSALAYVTFCTYYLVHIHDSMHINMRGKLETSNLCIFF